MIRRGEGDAAPLLVFSGHVECFCRARLSVGVRWPGSDSTPTRERMRRLRGTLVVVAVLATGCEPLAPEEQREAAAPALFSKVEEEAELTFARYAQGVGPGVAEAVLRAVVGQTSTLVVRYAGLPVLAQPVLLEFEVGPESLLTDGDGNPVVPGQAVEISVLLDPPRFIRDLAPPGVTFSKSDPARLRPTYEGAAEIVNADTASD